MNLKEVCVFEVKWPKSNFTTSFLSWNWSHTYSGQGTNFRELRVLGRLFGKKHECEETIGKSLSNQSI